MQSGLPQLPQFSSLLGITNVTFKRTDGLLIRGQMFSPRNSTSGSLDESRRSIRVSNKSILKSGDVLLGGKGRRYLIYDNGVEERGIGAEDFRVYKTIEMKFNGALYRASVVLDPITKRSDKKWLPLGTIFYSRLPLREAEDSLRIPDARYEIMTDYQIKIDDKIDNKIIIEQAEFRLGVYWGRMRDG